MNLLDVNVLVYSYRQDSSQHEAYRSWLQSLVNGPQPFALAEQALEGFLRITTHPRIFETPSRLTEVLDFVERLRSSPGCRIVHPSPGHWDLFVKLCRQADVRGNLIPDAWLAALAIESGCTWITTDRDFARFPGLRWRHPLKHDHLVENPDL